MVVYCDVYEILCYYIRSSYICIANEINLQSMYAEETFHCHLLTRNCDMLLHIVVCMINGLNMQFQISSYSFVN